MLLKTKGKALVVSFSLKQQGIADYGSLTLIRSLTFSSSSRALKTTIIVDLNDLANSKPLASSFPILKNKNVALTENFVFAF
jgi:hypothetical protein